ncbi:MAG: FkbM family methyltransferase [Myxococcota bacterium]
MACSGPNRRTVKRADIPADTIAGISVRVRASIAVIAVGVIASGCGDREVSPNPIEPSLSNYLKAFPFERFEIVEIPNTGRFYVDDNPSLIKVALRKGEPWSPELIEIFREYARPGTTAIDVGAHIGSLAVPLAFQVGPTGRVYAFEPQRRVYRELFHNLQLNGLDHATPLMLAVSSAPGILEMAPPEFDDGFTRIGSGGEQVEARTLDSFGFTDVSLIKIDVEGHEIEVLKGAEQTILKWHPALIVETGRRNKEQFLEPMLAEWGYNLRKIDNGWLDFLATYEDAQRAD